MQKTYVDFMREISANKLYKGLLAFGMFTDKLPPIFSAVKFFNYCKTITSPFANKPRQLVQFESMRNTNVPRLFSVPNPFAYQRLCKCLADNWNNICDHFENNTKNDSNKTSRIHIRKILNQEALFSSDFYNQPRTLYKDPIFDMNYRDWVEDGDPERNLLIGKQWQVKVDISTCFPSIYTHSLPWALVGKAVSKQNRNSGWFNDIDKLCQNMKDGETHGIPIGPHSSNLLSEIILTVVDKDLRSKWDYIRNIDDYTCYVKSHDEAELFIVEINEALRQFDLVLNHKKTEILELPKATVKNWTNQLEQIHLYERNGKLDYKSIRSYLDSAIRHMEENNSNSAILKYAIKVLANNDLTDNAKIYTVKTFMHFAVIYPYLIPLMGDYIFDQYSVNKSDIKSFTQLIFDNSISKKNYESASFCVYFALKYDFILSGMSPKLGIESSNCIFLVLVYLYAKKQFNAAEKTRIKKYAESLLVDEDEFERNWIFAYECLPESKLKNEWKPMKKAGVTFINFTQ